MINDKKDRIIDMSYSEIFYKCFGVQLSEDEARKRSYGIQMLLDKMDFAHVKEITLSQLPYNEITKIRDERNALNSEKRIMARKERFYDLLAAKMPKEKHPKPLLDNCVRIDTLTDAAVLQISDIHYGIEVDNSFNKYNVSVAEERIKNVTKEVLDYFQVYPFKSLDIVFQGDLISGKNHPSLRLQNQVNVVDQTFGVADLLTEMIRNFFHGGVKNITCHFVIGNHDRMSEKKDENLEEENFVLIVKRFIENECGDIVKFAKNDYGIDIANFEVNGLKFAAVHGDKDPFQSLRTNMLNLTGEDFDVILTAHKHEFRVGDFGQCTVIANGSLVGMDDYAKKLRFNSFPSQNLIIVRPNGMLRINPILANGGRC